MISFGDPRERRTEYSWLLEKGSGSEAMGSVPEPEARSYTEAAIFSVGDRIPSHAHRARYHRIISPSSVSSLVVSSRSCAYVIRFTFRAYCTRSLLR